MRWARSEPMVVVSPVTRASLPFLTEGLRALARDLRDPFRATEETLARALFAARPACYGLLAQEGAALRGVVLYAPLMSTAFGTPGLYVSDLWIAKTARGTGLGRQMLARVAQHGRAVWGASFLRLAAYDDNPDALAFYQRLGFQTPEGETTLRLGGQLFDDLARSG